MRQAVKKQVGDYNNTGKSAGNSNAETGKFFQVPASRTTRAPRPSTPSRSTSTATSRTSSGTAGRATERPAAGVPSGSRSAPKQADGQDRGPQEKSQRPRVVVPEADCPPIRQLTRPSTAGSSSPASSRASPQSSRSTQKPRCSADQPASSASPGSSVRTQRAQKDVLGNGLVESPVTVSPGGASSPNPLPRGKINTGANNAGAGSSTTKSLAERPATRSPAGSAGHHDVAQASRGKQAASAEEASLVRRNRPRTVDG
jgi:hypothetical protein